jgi:arylsulfatase A-like enzyme
VVRDAVEWLGSRRPAGRPYFLFLNFMDAHTPYALPPAGAQRSGRLPLSGRPGARAAQRLSAEESRHVRALHEAGVSQLDRHLGRLLAFLESQPGWDRTWLVITSDHGESLAEGRIFGHSCATLSQEVLHVPLILRDPRRPPGAAGARDDSPVQLVDIVPTLFQALGLDLPRKLGGVPIGQGRTAMLALTTCNCPGLQPGAGAGPAEAIVEAGHKYVRIGDAAPQLFDLVNDPGETRDLAAARPERLEQLRSSLDQSKRALAGPAEPCPECDNPRSEEALRALGYVR